jgi:predicted nucleic acid-binding protein
MIVGLDTNILMIDLIGSLQQIPLDFESARTGGAIYGQRIKDRIQMDPEDAMIAGVAKVRKVRLITRNVKTLFRYRGNYC